MELWEAFSLSKRAQLGDNLQESCQKSIDSLLQWKDYLENSYDALGEKYKTIHLRNYLVGLTSHIDAMISDCLHEVYVCFPPKLGGINLEVNEAAQYGNVFLNIENYVSKKISGILYRNFKAQIAVLSDELLDVPPTESHVNNVCELKATRDLIAHGEEKYNTKYQSMAEASSRGKPGETISITYEYAIERTVTVITLIREIKATLKQGYLSWNKSRVIKEMWTNSHMENVVPFDEGWTTYDKEDMVRPKDVILNWPWSSGEKSLFSFFKAIYYGLDNSELDLRYFFYRFPYHTIEGTFLLGWIQNPFFL